MQNLSFISKIECSRYFTSPQINATNVIMICEKRTLKDAFEETCWENVETHFDVHQIMGVQMIVELDEKRTNADCFKIIIMTWMGFQLQSNSNSQRVQQLPLVVGFVHLGFPREDRMAGEDGQDYNLAFCPEVKMMTKTSVLALIGATQGQLGLQYSCSNLSNGDGV